MRHKDWLNKLQQYFKERSDMPMRWGRNDCVMFACDAIEVMSGMDPAHWCRGRYDSKIGALRQVSLLGCRTFAEAIVKVSDEIMQRKPLAKKLEVGDIVLADIENLDPDATGPSAGVMSGFGMAVPGSNGLVFIENPKARYVWSL